MNVIKPVKKIQGQIEVPGDKSVSHRAVMLGAIARGDTAIEGLLDCDDCNYTIKAFRAMGIKITTGRDRAVIAGAGLRGLRKPAGAIYAGESGTTMRILPGILAGQDFETRIECAPSLARRPMKRIVEPLSSMGVDIKAAAGGLPPLTVRGGTVRPVIYRLPVPSAQVKSAVLFAGLYASGVTTVEEEFSSRDHTERMMAYFGAPVTVKGLSVSIRGGGELSARSFKVPGDISSAAFFMAGASIIPGSKVRICGVNINPTRAGIIDIMKKMGSDIRLTGKKDLFEPSADIEVVSGKTRGITIGQETVPSIIDELPVIFVLAAFSTGRTVIKGAGELRMKETDRINSMQENLRAMGAEFDVDDGDIIIEGTGSLNGAGLKSFGDHRTCMAMAIAAMAAKGRSSIDDIECVKKSFPGFFSTLDKLIAES